MKSLSFKSAVITLIVIISTNSYAQKLLTPDSVKSYGKGQLKYYQGIPFLWLEGTDYEVGYQYGFLLKEKIIELDRSFQQFKCEYMEKAGRDLPFLKRLAVKLFGNYYLKLKIKGLAAEKLSPDFLQQMKGISDGAGIPLHNIIEVSLAPDFAAHYGCSGFVIKNKNRIIQGRNFDIPFAQKELLKYPVITTYKINNKLTFTDIGSIFKLITSTGFNEAGITFSENSNNNPKPFDKGNGSLCIDIRKILTDCKTISDVNSVLQTVKIPYGYIYTITSTNENQAVVYDGLGSAKEKTNIDNSCYTTGRTFSEKLQKKTELIYSSSYHNYNREYKYNQLLNEQKASSIDNAINIISNNDFYHYDNQLLDIETINNFETTQSIIFDLSQNNVYFAFDNSYAAWNTWLVFDYKTVEVSLYKSRDKRADEPVTQQFVKICRQLELMNWKNNTEVEKMVNALETSGIDNFWCNDLAAQLYLFNLKNDAKAEIFADKLIKEYPDVATGWFYKGIVLKNKNKSDDAIKTFKNGLNAGINNDNLTAGLYEQLAMVYDKLGNKNDAKVNAQKSLDIYNQYWTPDWLKEKIEKLKQLTAN